MHVYNPATHPKAPDTGAFFMGTALVAALLGGTEPRVRPALRAVQSATLGLVHGETILGANLFRDLLASLRNIVGGRGDADGLCHGHVAPLPLELS